jgi:AcrR family transcriptional regulator
MERGFAYPRTGLDERRSSQAPGARAARVRSRILEAMVEAVAEDGYAAVTLEEVAGRADVPLTVLVEHFGDKADCYDDAFDLVAGRIAAQIAEHASPGDWPDQIRAAVDAVTDLFIAEPGLARMALVEVAAVGPRAMVRYREALERLHPPLERGRQYAARGSELPDGIPTMALGSAITILVEEASEQQLDSGRLKRELLFALLLPYLGPEEAASEVARA